MATFWLTTTRRYYILDIVRNDGQRTGRYKGGARADAETSRGVGRDRYEQSGKARTRRARDFRTGGAAGSIDSGGCRC